MVASFKWSIEDWHELVESGVLEDKPVQLLEGEIIEMSPEGIPHSYTNRNVVKYLRNLLEGLAEVIQAQPITLDNSEPQPDVTIARLPETIYKQHHPYPEDIYWLIEISNKTLKIDKTKKSKTYARNGIPEYWIIDLINKKLIVYTQPQGDSYTQVQEFATGTVAPQAFPNKEIPLNQLLLF
ncbi:MAG: Uma2 family endonuclease [Waterburya sp.]